MKLVIIVLLCLFNNISYAEVNEKNTNKMKEFLKEHDFSIHTLSWTKHYINGNPNQTEGFNNHLFMAGITIDKEKRTKIVLGTLNNSQNNRCIILGISRDWIKINDYLDFVGMYAYNGEIPGVACEGCGNDGIYRTFKNHTGVGFAPYIYHGIRFNATKNLSINSGIILPGLFASTIEFRF